MSSGVAKVATGNYKGTGAALEVKLPFAPKAVVIIDKTTPNMSVKSDQMPAGVHFDATGDAMIATEGISIPEQVAAGRGTVADFFKFSLGTDVTVNKLNDEYTFIALEG